MRAAAAGASSCCTVARLSSAKGWKCIGGNSSRLLWPAGGRRTDVLYIVKSFCWKLSCNICKCMHGGSLFIQWVWASNQLTFQIGLMHIYISTYSWLTPTMDFFFFLTHFHKPAAGVECRTEQVLEMWTGKLSLKQSEQVWSRWMSSTDVEICKETTANMLAASDVDAQNTL